MTTRPHGAADRRLTGWLAGLIWLAVAVAALAILVLVLADPSNLPVAILLIGVVLSFGIVGAIIVTRLPGNPIGWILWTFAVVLGWAIAGVSYASFSVQTCEGCLPGTVPIALVANIAYIPVVGAIGIFVPLLFPTGHLPSPRWRGVARFAVLALGLATVASAVAPGPMSSGGGIENPIGIPGVGPILGNLGIAIVGAVALSFVMAVASVIWRYRHGTQVERQQLRWFGYATLAMLVTVAIGFTGIGPLDEYGWLVRFAGLSLLPIATGVAILRYRLYDLDRLVSRTIAYGLVTGMLVATYAALILVLEGPMGAVANGDTLSVALSTLAVAALFTPVRRRVQRIVDRRFDRARYDAERTTAAFSERLRDEVDLATVTADLDGTVRRAMAPTTMGVWLRAGGR